MQYYTIKKGATSQIILVNIYDSSSSTGAKLTGLVYNSAGLTAYYYREGAGTGATAITLATATLGTYASGGFIVVDGTNMPGTYELHLPTGVTATGADRVNVHLKGATNMVPVDIVIDLTDIDLRDSVRAGLTALPNAAAGAAGGLPTDSAGKTSFNDIAATAIVSGGAITTSAGAVSTVTTTTNLTTNNDKTGYSLTATTGLGNQTANITGNLSGSVGSVTGSVGSISGVTFPTNFSALGIGATGKINEVTLVDTLTTYTGNTPQTGDAYARLGAPVGVSISTDIASIQTDTTAILTDTASIGVVKNAAFSNFEFLMKDSTDHISPKTGLTVTGYRSIDGGAFAAVAGTIAEVSNGIYQFDALAADTNGDVITWRFTATGADDCFVTIKTRA